MSSLAAAISSCTGGREAGAVFHTARVGPPPTADSAHRSALPTCVAFITGASPAIAAAKEGSGASWRPQRKNPGLNGGVGSAWQGRVCSQQSG